MLPVAPVIPRARGQSNTTNPRNDDLATQAAFDLHLQRRANAAPDDLASSG